MLEKAKQILNEDFDKMVTTLQESLRFRTITQPATKEYPFGEEIAKCLDYFLEKGEELGFKSHNVDYYAGHLDIGEGEEVAGVLGHIDVVPVSEEGWIAPPFSGEIVDGKIIGRGTLDDKGPMVSCMYAVKALMKAGFKPSKKIRLIIGCDEETGMNCMKYYKTKVKMPDIAFSPDGNFPLINCEKGIYGITINAGELPESVVSITAGDRVNVVPDYCEVVLKGKVCTSKCENVEVKYQDDLTIISATGKSAHGSMPDLGENATWKVFKALKEIFPENVMLAFIADTLSVDHHGEKWGLDLRDDVSGIITISMNVVRKVGNDLHLSFDIRFPVTYTHENIENLILSNSPNFKIVGGHKSSSVFIPKESFLVQSMLSAYKEVMGGDPQPMAIGGGTYAKCMDNCLAFGPEFPGDENTIHQTNEYVDLIRLKQMTEIYMLAIYNISK